MSGETPLMAPIKGYYITITNQNDDDGEVIMESELNLTKVGGAHVKNPEDLIMMIEDAVFNDQKDWVSNKKWDIAASNARQSEFMHKHQDEPNFDGPDEDDE